MNVLAIPLFMLLVAGAFPPTTTQNKTSEISAEQLNYDEPYNLVELLRLPAKTTITWKTGPLRPQASHKLLLGSRLDFAFEKEVQGWVQKWNGKNSRQYGVIKIVDDIAQADVILARYHNLRELVEETIVTEPSRTPNVVVNTMKTVVLARPQYSYVLRPKDDGFEIIWRQRKLIRQKEKNTQNSAEDLLSALAKRLKTK